MIEKRRLVGGPHEGEVVNYNPAKGCFITRFDLVGYVYLPLEPDDGRTLWIDAENSFDASDRAAECVGDEAERHLASM